MKKILLLLHFIILSTLFQSCGGKQKVTSAKFTLRQEFSSAFPGGLFLVAKNNNTNKTLSKKVMGSTINLELENGSWNFVALSWSGPGLYKGEVNCAVLKNVSLNGSSKTIDLSVSTNACKDPLISPSDSNLSNGEFLPIKFHSCGYLANFINEGEVIEFGMNCDSGMQGKSKSFQIAFYEFNPTQNPQPLTSIPTWSECVSVSGEDNFVASGIKLPFGSPSFKIPYQVKTFDSIGCSGAENVINFDNTFVTPAKDNKGIAQTTTQNTNLYLTSDLCTGNWLSNSPYAQGAYNPIGPNFICTKAQFLAIGSNPSGTYILGKDLDFSGTTYSDPLIPVFQGKIEGMGRVLKGITIATNVLAAGIIGLVNNPINFSIRDLALEDISITTTSTSSQTVVGALIGGVDFTNISSNSGIIDKINFRKTSVGLNSVSIVYTQSQAISAVGGLFGSAKLIANSINSDELVVSNITGSVSVVGSNAGFVGGITGMTDASYTNPGTASVRLEDNEIEGSILGNTSVGGFIGYARNTQIHGKNIFTGQISGIGGAGTTEGVGGLIGYNIMSQIIGAKVNAAIMIDNLSAATARIGGVVGNYNSGHISDVLSNVTINSSSNFAVNSVGGIVGYSWNNTCAQPSGILNSKAIINSTLNGMYQGGTVGDLQCGYIKGSSASGNINTKTPNDSLNSKRGGIAGYSKIAIEKVKSTVNIHGYEWLGGLVGFQSGPGSISEAFYKGNIVSNKNNSTVNNVGGAIGQNMYSSPWYGTYGDLFIEANFYWVANVNDVGFKEIVGNNDNASLTSALENSVVENKKFKDILVSPTEVSITFSECGGTQVCSLSVPGPITNCNPFGWGAGICPTNWNSNANLNFMGKWDLFKNGSSNLAGNRAEPFIIDSVATWNQIGKDSFLVTRSYKLINDLDFTGDTFVPIGGDSSVEGFSGRIIPNGKTLSGISYTASAGVPVNMGIFNKVKDQAKIGSYDDPLKVNGLVLDADDRSIANMGAIGLIEGGEVYLQIKNAHYIGDSTSAQCTKACGLGGIVGNVNNSGGSHVRIESSSFEGKIEADDFNNVGGLIGKAYVGADLYLRDSFAKIESISGNLKVGGLAGSLGSNGGSISVVYNFVNFEQTESDPNNFEINILGSSSSTLSGFIAETSSCSFALCKVNGNYVDLSKANFAINNTGGRWHFADLTDADFNVNYVLLDTYSNNSLLVPFSGGTFTNAKVNGVSTYTEMSGLSSPSQQGMVMGPDGKYVPWWVLGYH